MATQDAARRESQQGEGWLPKGCPDLFSPESSLRLSRVTYAPELTSPESCTSNGRFRYSSFSLSVKTISVAGSPTIEITSEPSRPEDWDQQARLESHAAEASEASSAGRSTSSTDSTTAPGQRRNPRLVAQVKLEDIRTWRVSDACTEGAVVLESREADHADPAGEHDVAFPAGSPSSGNCCPVPLKSLICKIGGQRISDAVAFRDWCYDAGEHHTDGVVPVYYRPPRMTLADLVRKEGSALHGRWQPRIDYLQGLWTDDNGVLLYEIDGFGVSVIWHALNMAPGQQAKQVTPLNGEVWMEDLRLVMEESSEDALVWQMRSGKTLIWRRPRKTDAGYSLWLGRGRGTHSGNPYEAPSEQQDAAQRLPARRKDRTKQGKLGRVLRNFFCCCSTSDIAGRGLG